MNSHPCVPLLTDFRFLRTLAVLIIRLHTLILTYRYPQAIFDMTLLYLMAMSMLSMFGRIAMVLLMLVTLDNLLDAATLNRPQLFLPFVEHMPSAPLSLLQMSVPGFTCRPIYELFSTQAPHAVFSLGALSIASKAKIRYTD